MELGSHEPVFDIVVSAEKKVHLLPPAAERRPRSGYQLGSPRPTPTPLAALEMMDFEGIEKVRQRVRQNGTLPSSVWMQAQMAQLTGLLEVQKKSEAPKASGPA